jgi:hypothetical protein
MHHRTNRSPRTAAWVIGLVLAGSSVVALADTLVLRDGQRIRGTLVGVAGREIEFEERRGRRVRIPREEVERIEFERDFDTSRDDRGGTGVPRGMRERRVSVSSTQQWTDTGIDVRAGQEIYFVSSGQVRWGPSRRDGVGGERNSPENRNRPIANRPGAALIGKVSDRDEFFFIGEDSGPFRARSSGRLFLGINDDVLTDNSGSFTVDVSF